MTMILKTSHRGVMFLVRRVALAFLVCCSLSAGVAVWWWSSLQRSTPAPETTVVVPRGASTTQVLKQLVEARLLPSVLSGRLYLELLARGKTPHWGIYRFKPESRPVDVLDAILEGRVETFSLTILEGAGRHEIGEILLSMGLPGAEGWNALVENADWIADLAPEATTLDGFLFPDTYRFASGTDAVTVARTLVHRFRQVWAEESRSTTPFLQSVFDTVTLASLVEAETSLPEERARVAGVFTNRLARGMLLQCDPTVVFALQRRGEWSGRLLRVHWEIDDPYNTYRYPGLPPGPVNNPGRAAITAALSPETHTYLYFVAQPGGGHSFSRTLKEHNSAVAKMRRSRH